MQSGDGEQPSREMHREEIKKKLEGLADLLRKIQPPARPPPWQEDRRYRDEESFLLKQQKKQELEDREQRARVESFEEYHRNRRRYTGRIFWLLVAWLVGVLAILLATGIKDPTPSEERGSGWQHWLASFELSDVVLVALIGSSSANVIGVFVIVVRFLFPRDGTNGHVKRASTL